MRTKRIFFVCCIILLISLSGCSFSEKAENLGDTITNKIEVAKQELYIKVQAYVEKKVNSGVDSAVKDIESTIDPKLREIRKNMQNVKDTALIYYKINKKMPIQQKIEGLFPTSFKQMNIEYRISNDSQRAFITYTGKEYTKEKVGELIVEPNN